MISVIVPVYNVRPYIHEAVDSLLAQTYSDLEIILIDDGSTDGSGEVCDEYTKKDRRISVIHQSNRGQSAARNAGLDRCQGDMIAFLDPDDAFCTNTLSVMADAMKTSGADIVECNYASYPEGSRLDPKKADRLKTVRHSHAGVYPSDDALRMQVRGQLAFSVCCQLYTRNVWSNLRFRENQFFEDLDIILPLLNSARTVCILDKTFLLRRTRPGSTTQTLSLRNFRDYEAAFTHYMDFIGANIPDLFSEDDMDCARIYRYTELLSNYYRYIQKHIPQKDLCIAFLKEHMQTLAHDMDLSKCPLRLRAASWLCFHSPGAVSGIVGRIYLSYRMVSRKIPLLLLSH